MLIDFYLYIYLIYRFMTICSLCYCEVLKVCENDLKCASYERYKMISFNFSENKSCALSTFPFTGRETSEAQAVPDTPAIHVDCIFPI